MVLVTPASPDAWGHAEEAMSREQIERTVGTHGIEAFAATELEPGFR